MNISIFMTLNRKGPAFPKFKSGTLKRMYISRPENDEPQRERKGRKPNVEKPIVDWFVDTQKQWNQTIAKHDEKTTWHMLREKTGFKVALFFAQQFRERYATERELRKALHALEMHHLQTKYPKMNNVTVFHEAVEFLRILGF